MLCLPSYSACLALDAMLWLGLFLWIGAPVLNSEQPTTYTACLSVLLAVLVAVSWPIAPRKCKDGFESGFLRWAAALAVVLRDQCEQSRKEEEEEHNRREAPQEKHLDRSNKTASPTLSEMYACVVLCVALLLGGLCSQLDWQVVFQQWPHPHLALYSVVRALIAVCQQRWRRPTSPPRVGAKTATRLAKKHA